MPSVCEASESGAPWEDQDDFLCMLEVLQLMQVPPAVADAAVAPGSSLQVCLLVCVLCALCIPGCVQFSVCSGVMHRNVGYRIHKHACITQDCVACAGHSQAAASSACH